MRFLPDRRLARRIVEGDLKAGEQFVRQNYPRIFRVLRTLSGDPELAQDLAQQTFVQAWQGLAGYSGTARLSTWLHRIAFRVYTHWLRDRKQDLPLDTLPEEPAERPLDGLIGLQVERAIARLAPPLREAFVLCGVWQYSLREAADILEVPVGTIKSRMHEARKALRAMLGTEQEHANERVAAPLRERGRAAP